MKWGVKTIRHSCYFLIKIVSSLCASELLLFERKFLHYCEMFSYQSLAVLVYNYIAWQTKHLYLMSCFYFKKPKRIYAVQFFTQVNFFYLFFIYIKTSCTIYINFRNNKPTFLTVILIFLFTMYEFGQTQLPQNK